MPLITLSSELLPAPFGPMSAQISPAGTSRLTSSSARTPRNVSEMCSRRRSAVPGTVFVAMNDGAANGGAGICGAAVVISRRRLLRRPGLELAHQRQDAPSEVLDVFQVVQESAQNQVHALLLVGDDPARNLLGCADEPSLEPVVVLDQVVEVRLGPHALALGGPLPRLLHRLAEPVHRLDVGLGDDLAQHVARLRL